MQAELVNRDGTGVLVALVTTPPPEVLVVLERPAVGTRPGVGLAIGFPSRRYVRRPWSPGQTPVYDETGALP